MAGLADHRPEAAQLPREPFEHGLAPAQVRRQEPAGLFGQVDQDGAGLEHRERPAAVRRIVIDDRRHPVVRADGEEVGFVLFAPIDVDGDDPVVEIHFLQGDGDLPSIGRRPVIGVDHGPPSSTNSVPDVRANVARGCGNCKRTASPHAIVGRTGRRALRRDPQRPRRPAHIDEGSGGRSAAAIAWWIFAGTPIAACRSRRTTISPP